MEESNDALHRSADTVPVLDRGEIHLVSEFIRPMYNSAAGADWNSGAFKQHRHVASVKHGVKKC